MSNTLKTSTGADIFVAVSLECGLFTSTKVDSMSGEEDRAEAMAGVEVHAATEDGRLIVTVEDDNDRVLADTVLSLHDVPGVLSAAMVYHQYEDETL